MFNVGDRVRVKDGVGGSTYAPKYGVFYGFDSEFSGKCGNIINCYEDGVVEVLFDDGESDLGCPSNLELIESSIPAGAPTQGLRYNDGKPRYDLLPPDAIRELVNVLTTGAEKYEARNWEKGMPYMSCLASLKRHIAAWEIEGDRDDESGHYHMAHVMWNAMAILTWQLREIGEDDHPRIG